MNNLNGALSGIRAVTCSTAQAGTVPYMSVSYTHLTLPTNREV